MIQLDQVKSELPAAKANLAEVGDVLNMVGVRKRFGEMNRDIEYTEFLE